MKKILLALLLATIAIQPAFAEQIPATEMDNLDGETMHFPAAFQGNPTVVILAFAHEQREEAIRVMGLLQKAHEANHALTWYELPIIDAPSVVHFFIRNGMSRRTDEAMHAHIVPQFVDEDEWHKSSGIAGTEPLLAKVDHDGKILKSVPLSAVKTADDIVNF